MNILEYTRLLVLFLRWTQHLASPNFSSWAAEHSAGTPSWQTPSPYPLNRSSSSIFIFSTCQKSPGLIDCITRWLWLFIFGPLFTQAGANSKFKTWFQHKKYQKKFKPKRNIWIKIPASNILALHWKYFLKSYVGVCHLEAWVAFESSITCSCLTQPALFLKKERKKKSFRCRWRGNSLTGLWLVSSDFM